MSGKYIRGALVEYTSEVLGPLPNIVVFQFNPEQIARTLNIPQRRTTSAQGARPREVGQTSAAPLETFPITARFSAADDLGKGGAVAVIPRMYGVGPQLAALENMIYPAGGIISGAVEAIVDAVGDALDTGIESTIRTVPKEQLPRILFIWGRSRVLPVEIQSLSITEQKYDALLNPVQAEVQLGLAIQSFPSLKQTRKEHEVGIGALMYTQIVKATQAELNLARTAEFAPEIIPF